MKNIRIIFVSIGLLLTCASTVSAQGWGLCPGYVNNPWGLRTNIVTLVPPNQGIGCMPRFQPRYAPTVQYQYVWEQQRDFYNNPMYDFFGNPIMIQVLRPVLVNTWW